VPSGVIQEWYAPFTGLVKSIDSEGNTLELISFNLKPEPEEFGVIELRGDVKINEQEARTDWIYDGDFTIETARDAKVVLYFGNNQRLTIEGASKSEISHKKKEPDASIETIITLFRGKLLILVNEFFQERRLKVETHGAWAGVRGTKFSVEVKEDRDIIEVFEGEVEVKEKKTGKIFILKAGEKKVILY
jgi:hypothetical protein